MKKGKKGMERRKVRKRGCGAYSQSGKKMERREEERGGDAADSSLLEGRERNGREGKEAGGKGGKKRICPPPRILYQQTRKGLGKGKKREEKRSLSSSSSILKRDWCVMCKEKREREKGGRREGEPLFPLADIHVPGTQERKKRRRVIAVKGGALSLTLFLLPWGWEKRSPSFQKGGGEKGKGEKKRRRRREKA